MKTNIELMFYDKKENWKLYDDNIEQINRAKKVITLIPNDINSVLDIGCGNGIITNMIKKPFVVGLDFAKLPLTKLKTHAICANIDELPIKSKKFDLIILTEILEHLNDNIYTKAINEIKRLKANYLIISVPSNENIENGLCKCNICGNLFHIFHHYRKFDGSWFYKLFSEYDLKRLEYTSYRILPNDMLVKLEHKFGSYATCNMCGGHPIKKNNVIKYVFGAIGLYDTFIKRAIGFKKPYHMILLLKRKENISI